MKIKKVEKVITTLNNRIGHPLKRHLTEIPTRFNNLKRQAGIGTEIGDHICRVHSLNSGKVSIQIQLKSLPELSKWTLMKLATIRYFYIVNKEFAPYLLILPGVPRNISV